MARLRDRIIYRMAGLAWTAIYAQLYRTASANLESPVEVSSVGGGFAPTDEIFASARMAA